MAAKGLEARLAAAALGAAVVAAALLVVAAAIAAEPGTEDPPQARVLYVGPGQSLGPLVRRSYPDVPRRWDAIRRWIVEHNPHAFVDGDPARLRGDVRLILPSLAQVPGAAAREPARDAATGTGAAEAGAGAAEAGAGAAAAGIELRFGNRYVFVDPAQSLRKLAPRLYPRASERWAEIIDAIIERNAERLARFADRAGSGAATIGRGTRLSIPRIVHAQPEPTRAPGPEPRIEPVGPEAPLAPPIGRVITARGEVHAIGRRDRRRALFASALVRRDDAIRTGPEARARIRMNDGEQLFIRAASRVRVRDWELPEVGPGTRVLELVRGGMRAVSGVIGNRSDDDYRTITPLLTLGVRGTQYALRLCGAGDCRAGGETLDPGLYLGVNSGRVSLLNETGETIAAAGDYRHVAGPDSAPRPADPAVAGILYVEGEQVARAEPPTTGDEQARAEEAQEDDGKRPWWLAFGLLLLAL